MTSMPEQEPLAELRRVQNRHDHLVACILDSVRQICGQERLTQLEEKTTTQIIRTVIQEQHDEIERLKDSPALEAELPRGFSIEQVEDTIKKEAEQQKYNYRNHSPSASDAINDLVKYTLKHLKELEVQEQVDE